MSDFNAYLDWLVEHGRQVVPKAAIRQREPEHPGIVLQRDFLALQSLSQSELARRIGCSHAKVNDVVHCRRGISPRFALDLERVLGTPAAMWVSLQADFDLWVERQRSPQRR